MLLIALNPSPTHVRAFLDRWIDIVENTHGTNSRLGYLSVGVLYPSVSASVSVNQKSSCFFVRVCSFVFLGQTISLPEW